MGTNYIDYLTEAHRILKENGHLLIYEVVSRIDDLDVFVATVEGVGFKCSFRDESNKMFVEVHFEARSVDTGATAAAPATLNPCIYKRR
jgi:ribosomal RNA-processing protein 8